MTYPLATIARQLLGKRGTGYFQSPADARDELHAWQRRLGAGRTLSQSKLGLVRHVHPRDQGGTNSCTVHAVDYAIQALCGTGRGPKGREYTPRSVAAPYWHARALNHLERGDAGAVLRSALRAHQHLGAPSEAAWPLAARTINQQPGADSYRLGHPWRGLGYSRIEGDVVTGALDALQSDFPVIIGLGLDDAFRLGDGPTAVLDEVPGASQTLFHALMLAGFTRTAGNPASLRFRTPNSWGTGWRDGGFCELGPAVVASALEAWVVTGWPL